MKEADKIEVEKRLRQVEKWLLSGFSMREMLQNASKKWGITQRQVYSYIETVMEKWKEEQKKESKKNYNKAIARREFLYKKAVARRNYLTALSIEKDIRELQGLYKLKIEHSGSIEEKIKIYIPDNKRGKHD